MQRFSSVRILTREGLKSFKRMAMRRGLWFGVLTRGERGVVDLSIRFVDRVRSATLAMALGKIVCKVSKAFRSTFLERIKKEGRELAERISNIAVGWGYSDASSWKEDKGFILYLGVNIFNKVPGWDPA